MRQGLATASSPALARFPGRAGVNRSVKSSYSDPPGAGTLRCPSQSEGSRFFPIPCGIRAKSAIEANFGQFLPTFMDRFLDLQYHFYRRIERKRRPPAHSRVTGHFRPIPFDP